MMVIGKWDAKMAKGMKRGNLTSMKGVMYKTKNMEREN